MVFASRKIKVKSQTLQIKSHNGGNSEYILLLSQNSD